MVVVEVRLVSKNGVTTVDTKLRKKEQDRHHRLYSTQGRKRPRQDYAEKGEEDNESADIESERMFDAAQAQLQQEMLAAGLEGSLPLSFGSRKRTGANASKKRKRARVMRSNADDMKPCDSVNGVKDEKSNCGLAPIGNPDVNNAVVEKLHVKYDSDGEITKRYVEVVEFGEQNRGISPETNGMTGKLEEESDGNTIRSALSAAKGEFVDDEQIQHDTQQQHSVAVVHTSQQLPPTVDESILKFWKQRKSLFYKYDEGILLDYESWYSVTPQAIAEYIASRCQCDIIVDPFAGCGGNVIQLAMTCKQVIAIDIDPEKIRMAKHNAAIYGVADKIEFIVGNSIDILPNLKADVVFLSPPWGGLKYNRDHFRLDEMMVKDVCGVKLFAIARKVTKNVVYYLPKTTPSGTLEALCPDEVVECENMYLNRQWKVIIAYYGDLVDESLRHPPITSPTKSDESRTSE